MLEAPDLEDIPTPLVVSEEEKEDTEETKRIESEKLKGAKNTEDEKPRKNERPKGRGIKGLLKRIIP